jgi:hypothetical protein
MKERVEKENRERGFDGKRKRGRGSWEKCPSSSPGLHPEQR